MSFIIYQFSQKTRLIQEGKPIGVQPEQKVTVRTQTKHANRDKLKQKNKQNDKYKSN